MNGESNTSALQSKIGNSVTADGNITNAEKALSFAHTYSRKNANGYGLTEGTWWVPSLGEMLMIYSNLTAINYALSLITGAEALSSAFHWTSTEYNANNLWYIKVKDATMDKWGTKASSKNVVRPVSKI